MRTFIDQFANINQGIAAGERIFSIIDTKPEIQDKPDARELTGLKDKIEFRNVHFTYDGSREVIDGISFEIRRGQTVALVDLRVAGKSTLSELLPRFYDPTSGEILIDGVSLRDYSQESVRAHMSVVAQDTVLFNDTIENNIGMGRRGASHEEIVEARPAWPMPTTSSRMPRRLRHPTSATAGQNSPEASASASRSPAPC